jgi:signal transduction histidine kinase
MALHDVLAATRDEVIERWKAQIRGTLAPEAMPASELVDHIPEFVDEIVFALRADAGLAAPDVGPTAAGHGAQRLRLGFSLESVVREYGTLRDAIVDTARSGGHPITFRELQILFDGIVDGIARAVAEYTRQRDAELSRQANEHFAFVAHELRDPLSSASTAFQLLKYKGQLPADGRAVGALERGLVRASELIDQTLQMARVASGIELHPQPTTLAALFDEAEVSSVSEADAKDIDIRAVVTGDDVILLDTRLVRSALGNLVRNAVKYTPSGHRVEVRGHLADGRAVIEVEDRCGGLPPGKVEAAFGPFVRLTEREQGFGLGLAIAKQAVDAHGGSIRVQNLPGRGCIFVLEFPIAV